MFIESLLISTPTKVIRELRFHKGLNLIVDQTLDYNTNTGNNVGKTTVLKLIDFCLGKNADVIYQDPENKKQVYRLVKDFLVKNAVIITLTLIDNLDNPNKKIEISRNFLPGMKAIRTINGEQILQKDFEVALRKAIFPMINMDKPSFRQIISHNIRYDEWKLTHTLNTIDSGFAKDEEYESLNLFLFGCDHDNGERKQELSLAIKNEITFKKRLEKQETKGAYKSALEIIESDIEKLNQQKKNLNINTDLDKDLHELNDIKSKINRISSDISSLSIRKSIILDLQKDFINQKVEDDLSQLKMIYDQASMLIPALQKSFEELVQYHNQMIDNKIKFVTEELPEIEISINNKEKMLNEYRKQEKVLSDKVSRSDTFSDLEVIIDKLTQLHQKKGNYESIITQIDDVDNKLEELNKELNSINDNLFADSFKKKLDLQLSKFNRIFSEISSQIYDEQYVIKYDVTEKNGKNIYKFSPSNINFSSGKKQGEISCFDIAYTKFADQENIPCLHFLLNDKKELVHNHQLERITEVVKNENVQFVASILEDKLPVTLKNENYYIIKLSQDSKLFRIEEFNENKL